MAYNYQGQQVRPGDIVTITNRFGQKSTGKVVFSFPDHLTLNMGGKYGTPAIANESNIVRIRPAKSRRS